MNNITRMLLAVAAFLCVAETLNVIDFDMDEEGQVLRKTVRAMNVTADDPVKGHRHSGDMESLTHRMLQKNGETGTG